MTTYYCCFRTCCNFLVEGKNLIWHLQLHLLFVLKWDDCWKNQPRDGDWQGVFVCYVGLVYRRRFRVSVVLLLLVLLVSFLSGVLRKSTVWVLCSEKMLLAMYNITTIGNRCLFDCNKIHPSKEKMILQKKIKCMHLLWNGESTSQPVWTNKRPSSNPIHKQSRNQTKNTIFCRNYHVLHLIYSMVKLST